MDSDPTTWVPLTHPRNVLVDQRHDDHPVVASRGGRVRRPAAAGDGGGGGGGGRSREEVISDGGQPYRQWLDSIYARYERGQLNTFEHNPRVWGQLMHVLSQSTALLLVADVRNPMFHIPPSLVSHVAELGKPLVVALSKCDLVPQSVVDKWSRWVKLLYPSVQAVVPVRAVGSSLSPSDRLAVRRKHVRESRRANDHRSIEARAGFCGQILEQAGCTPAQVGAVQARVRAAAAPTAQIPDQVAAVKGDGEGAVAGIVAMPASSARRGLRGQAAREAEASARAASKGGGRKKANRRRRRRKGKAGRVHDDGDDDDDDDDDDGGGGGGHQTRRGRARQDDRSEANAGLPAEPATHILGLIGHPNVGKSTILNALAGEKRVSVSRTPGHTKRAQTIPLQHGLTLLDCPGLLFPFATGAERAPVPGAAAAAAGAGGGRPLQRVSSHEQALRDRGRALQELCGLVPLAQVREPYTAVRLLMQHLPLPRLYGVRCDPDDVNEAGEASWSALSFCESLARKRGILIARVGRPDGHAAGRSVLMDAVDGVLPIWFTPPSSVDMSGPVMDEAGEDDDEDDDEAGDVDGGVPDEDEEDEAGNSVGSSSDEQ